MKILIYGNFLDYQVQLANELCKTESVMIIVSSYKYQHESLDNVNENIYLEFLGKDYSLYTHKNLFILNSFLKKIKNFDPDIVHIQIGGGVSLFNLPFILFLMKYPLITTFHDIKPHLGEYSRIRNFIPYLLRKYSNQIIVHGNRLKNQILTEYNISSKIVNSVPIGEHETEPFKMYEKPDLKEDNNLILFFGRIYEYKGLKYLIEAEPTITREIPNAKIIIAGTGEDFEKYQDMMVNKENFIVHNYRISYQEGAELFQRSSVIVLPYIEGSQSGVIPTAYSFKKPVVVTDVGSIPEIVDDGVTGLIVPARNSDELAKAIIKILNDNTLRKNMGERAYIKLKTDLSWDNIAKKTIEIYKRAMTSN
ncbi:MULTISPECIES: glycosyltransferase family 4 protein [Methanosarcina]|jgi:glycosyltransferase involved in cell wall biosynthesis|uniref:Glycosyltransferase n=1 Tax=Methanosarcina mazei TaxID=2209 RepID=A0A0F8IKJ1_METMZ|nr:MULTISPECIES: glycosyltransferase family 4 protein [Methanosarcina]KKG81081.1 hypothetical protein DU55_09865 [Methanosarcina mazei]KKG89656.1 hypothetical protein DU69_07575 [Methanosarcina mazei]